MLVMLRNLTSTLTACLLKKLKNIDKKVEPYFISVRILLSGRARKKKKRRVLTWPVRVSTVVPLWAAYGLGLVVITTL